MRESKRQESIVLVRDKRKKSEYEMTFRDLWRNCFHDPEAYEEFYFGAVYPNNFVYTLWGKGMLHVNGYRCQVMGEVYNLPYIVGVATNKKYRRQGIMKHLLCRAMQDMREEKVPFAYLMPAKMEYYSPFDFYPVTSKQERHLKCGPSRENALSAKEDLRYISYHEIKQWDDVRRQELFQLIDEWMSSNYQVYACRDACYYDLLLKEKQCQDGDVIFAFTNENTTLNLCGVFAYVMDGATPYVEQVLCKDSSSDSDYMLEPYFTDKEIVVMDSYCYMLRVIHVDEFLDLFGSLICSEEEGKKTLCIVDEWLPENCGEFELRRDGENVIVTRTDSVGKREGEKSFQRDCTSECDCVTMTVAELISYVFEEKERIYFAEIV